MLRSLQLVLCRTTRRLEQLGLGGGSCQLSSETLTAIAQHCPKLRVLAVSHVRRTNTSLEELARLCPHIASLSVTDNELLTDAGLLSVVCQLSKLQALNVLFNKHLTDTSLLHIGEHCAALEDLYISKERFSEAAVAALRAKCNKLQVHVS